MKFSSEAELCNAFTDHAVTMGWLVYPETSDWDLLLERADGSQCGVQAKLAPNVDVLWQAYRGSIRAKSPDTAAVLVPAAKEPFRDLAMAIGVGVITPVEYPDEFGELKIGFDWTPGAKRTDLRQRCWKPEFVPDQPAGVPSPKRVTPWKERAIHCCVILREKGKIRTKELSAYRMNPRDWIEHGYIKRICQGFYTIKEGAKLPDEDHPEFTAKVRQKLYGEVA
jgi:hypothetical protein